MKPKVLVAEPLAQEGVALLEPFAAVDLRLGLKHPELVARIGDYEGLIVRSETQVSSDVIAAGEKLQVIGRAGVGVSNIDLDAATRRGIVVVNAPTGNTVSAAEHTLALMLAMARHVPQANARLKSGEWDRHHFMGIELQGKTLGIVGLGKVGSEVAKRAQALGMRLIAFDPFVPREHARNLGAEPVSLEELLKQSDFITVHTPLTSATKGLIGPTELRLVKPTVRLVNTARGDIIDEQALYQALEEGRVAGAAVDVFSEEPARDNILLKSDKVIATPHLGASTAEAQVNVSVDIAKEVLAVLKGEAPRYALNIPLMSPEVVPVLGPYLRVASDAGSLATQLVEGQLGPVRIRYDGEIANYETRALNAAVIKGLLEPITEERVNLVNASVIAANRGLRIVEEKTTTCENYSSLITVELTTSAGVTSVAGTLMRNETHIVRVNNYWLDVVPTGGYWLFSDHRDRPRLIGTVGLVLGNADINISSMQVARLQPRGQALMVLGLDEPVGEKQRQELLAIPDVYTVKVVKL